MPRQTSVQLTEATERQVDELKAKGFGSMTDVIRIAIDRMWRDECTTPRPHQPMNPSDPESPGYSAYMAEQEETSDFYGTE